MRKDVKLGLAIGGLLFVVVLSYVIFFTGPKPKQVSTGPTTAPAATRPVVPVAAAAPAAVARDNAPPGRGRGGRNRPAPTTGVASVPPPPTISSPPPLVAPSPTTRPTPVVTAPPPPPPLTPSGNVDWAWLLAHGATSSAGSAPAPTPAPAVATTTPPPVRTISTPPPAAAAAAPAPTVAPPSLTSANSANHTHIVKQGENYWTISVAEYGSGAYVNQLMAANPNIPANRLRIDMPIVVPPKDKVVPAGAVASAATAGPTTRPLNPAKEYRVKSGDSLYSISTALYGKADRLEKIYDLNKTAIGPDKGKLKLGMVLQLPEPPTAGTSSRVADITR